MQTSTVHYDRVENIIECLKQERELKVYVYIFPDHCTALQWLHPHFVNTYIN